MPTRNARAAVLLSLSVIFTSFQIQAQTPLSNAGCSQAIDDLDRQTESFVRDVKQENYDFIKTDIRDTALSGIKKHFAGNPTSDAAFDLKEKYEKWDDWRQSVVESRTTMEELQLCLATKCSLVEFAKRQNQAIAKWIQSLGDEGINAATERVNKAASLIQGYASRALSMATGSALSAVDACKTQFEQRAQSTSQDAPDFGTTPAAGGGTPPATGGTTPVVAGEPAVKPSAGGRSAARAVVLIGGAAAAGLAAAKYYQDQQGGTCGNEPSINFDACFVNSAGSTCQTALRQLDAYCVECGMRRGREGNATNCVK